MTFFRCKFVLLLEQCINQYEQLPSQFPLTLLILIWSLITNLYESAQ